jgi:biopolymer transport protein ExbB
MNLIEIVSKGGWLMFPIILCSLIAAYVVANRLVVLNKSKSNTNQLIMKIKSLVLKGGIKEAIDLCMNTPGPAAYVMKEGLLRAGKSKEDLRNAVEAAGKDQVYYLEHNMGILATIAGVAPLIGFLGTVTGMMSAFMEIERLSGNVNATVLAGGIWEALMTTAAGLIVGIPTFIFYNYLVGKVGRIVFEIESSSDELLEMLAEEKTTSNSYGE